MLLVIALTPLVTQMLATWARGSDVAGIVEFRVNGLGVLRDDLRRAIVWTGYGRLENLLVFRGDETSFTFPSVSGHSSDFDGLQMISVRISSSVDGQAIIRTRAPIIGTTYTPLTDPIVLLSGSDKYFFSYYGRGGEQRAVWTDPLEYPARVVLNILNSRDRLSAIPIEIPILASASAACLGNVNLPGCPSTFQPAQDDDPLKSAIPGQ